MYFPPYIYVFDIVWFFSLFSSLLFPPAMHLGCWRVYVVF